MNNFKINCEIIKEKGLDQINKNFKKSKTENFNKLKSIDNIIKQKAATSNDKQNTEDSIKLLNFEYNENKQTTKVIIII